MLRDGFLGSPGPVADTKCVIDDLLTGLGTGRLSNVDDLAVGTLERNGDTILTGERAAYPLPAQMDPGRLELEANRVHQMVGKHGDEQVSAHPVGLAVKDRA